MPWPGLPLAAPARPAPPAAGLPAVPVPSGALPSGSVPPRGVAPAAVPPGPAGPGRAGRCHSPGGAIRSPGGDAVRACGRAHSTGMTRSGGAARGLGGAGRPAGGAAAGTRSMAWNPETGVSVPSPDRSWPSGSPRPYEPEVRPGGVLGAAGPETSGIAPAGAAGSSSRGTTGSASSGASRRPGTSSSPAVSQCVPAASGPYAPAAGSSGNGGGEKGGMSVSEVAAMYSLKDPLLKSGAYSSKGPAGYSGAGSCLPRAGLRSRLNGFRCSGKVIGPHVRPATAAKLIPRGNGMPVIASPHRSPLSVPAVDHPPCQRADIRAFQPGPQTG